MFTLLEFFHESPLNTEQGFKHLTVLSTPNSDPKYVPLEFKELMNIYQFSMVSSINNKTLNLIFRKKYINAHAIQYPYVLIYIFLLFHVDRYYTFNYYNIVYDHCCFVITLFSKKYFVY